MQIRASAFTTNLSALYLVRTTSPSFVQLQTWLAEWLGALPGNGMAS